MKKRVLAQVMGAVLVAGLMAGCGGASDTKEESTKTESAAEADSEDSAESESTDTEESDSEAASGDDSAEAETEKADGEDVSSEAADGEDAQPEASADTARSYGDVISAAGWNITVEDVEINASLENVSVDLGYTGVETSDYKKEADAGKAFCLIKMKIEKDGSKENLDWANLKLTDSEGNEYTRTEDEFITELGMTRMPGTTLNFGSNEGWIAFEINENAEGLELSYPFEAEEYRCAL